MEESKMIGDIWDVVKEYIPEKDKLAAADHLMPHIVDMGLPGSDFMKLVKSDEYLLEAAQEYLEPEDDEDADFENDEW